MKTILKQKGAIAVALLNLLPSVITAQVSHTNYVQLLAFGPPVTSAIHPQSALLHASDGWLYGTAPEGGPNNGGAVFRLRSDGSGYRELHVFTNSPGDGANPVAGLIEGSDGALYGTTRVGGAFGQGTVFRLRLTPDGVDCAVLHNFRDTSNDGGYPEAGLIEGSDSMLYGTTRYGGAGSRGTVYRLHPDGGGFTVLQSFSRGEPSAALLETSDGVLFGVLRWGGSVLYGSIFRLNRDGTDFRTLHEFAQYGWQGSYPDSALVEGPNRRLYGTAQRGGWADGGTLFSIKPDGSDFRVDFGFGSSTGMRPNGLVRAASGMLYGTTRNAAEAGQGAVFQFNGSGSPRLLRHFRNSDQDGRRPSSAPAVGRDGGLYGTTYDGGTGSGTVFALHPEPRCWFTGRTRDTHCITSLEGRGTAGGTFRLQFTTNLSSATWQDIATATSGIIGTLGFTNLPYGEPAGFYRLVAP